jgi:hypothetical protein
MPRRPPPPGRCGWAWLGHAPARSVAMLAMINSRFIDDQFRACVVLLVVDVPARGVQILVQVPALVPGKDTV